MRVFHSLFQEFEPSSRYDTIVAGEMLHHLQDPLAFLRKARGWLNDDGQLVATVPNSRSLHRRIGALLNMEPTPTHLNEREREVGSRRTYDRYELRHLLQGSGFDVLLVRGCFLKPLSSQQMESWRDELLRAFLEVGEELQDYCLFLYAVCRKESL